MLTAISAVIGFLGSIVPQIMKFWQQREDRKHELAMYDKTLAGQKILGNQKLEATGIEADTAETAAILKAAEPKITGVRWVDAFIQIVNGLMRPFVVYLYFLDYLLIKYATYLIITKTGNVVWTQAIQMLWTEFDQAMFGGIMGFLFGNRSMGHWFDRK